MILYTYLILIIFFMLISGNYYRWILNTFYVFLVLMWCFLKLIVELNKVEMLVCFVCLVGSYSIRIGSEFTCFLYFKFWPSTIPCHIRVYMLLIIYDESKTTFGGSSPSVRVFYKRKSVIRLNIFQKHISISFFVIFCCSIC